MGQRLNQDEDLFLLGWIHLLIIELLLFADVFPKRGDAQDQESDSQ